MNISEAGHIVNILPPVDITGGVYGDVFSMAQYDHASIIVQVGASAAAFTKILLLASVDNTGHSGTSVAIPFNCYKQETAAADVLGAAVAVEATGVTPSANDNIFYVIEVCGAELPAGKPYLELHLTNGVNSVIASAVAILTGARHGQESSPTVLT